MLPFSQELFNAVLSLLFIIIGWIARTLWDAMRELKVDLAALREDLPKTYITKDDHKDDVERIRVMFKEDTREIKNILDKIWEKIDKKADK